MTCAYPDRVICWPDRSTIPDELRTMLLDGLEPGFEIEHGEFSWDADNSLNMRIRLSVTRRQPKPQIWEITLKYPVKDATAVHAEATSEERKWFTMMVRTHIAEWWDTGDAVVVTASRHIK